MRPISPIRYVATWGRLATALVTGAMLRGGPLHGEAVGDLKLPPGFRAELVYSVRPTTQGSWVSLTVDHRGRLIASDQNGALYRIQPSSLGGNPAATKVEEIPVGVGRAQGLVCVGDKLYVVLNGRVGAFRSGLYRLSDANGDDRYDRFEQLRMFQGEGEHGPHGVVGGPDGKSLYIIAGNHTGLPLFDRSLAPPRWGEDQILPRIYDPMGQTNALKAPGGWLARTDLDGNNMELFSVGFRNAYDLAFNADGELFTFDSDMEWDIGTPWYRPTRVLHVTSGADFGWRSGNGVWPAYFPDTLPAAVDVGPGSPTGVTFGAGARFPPKYQQALFVGDWSYGNIYAVHLTAEGASYRGELEPFASAMPLGVTDLVVRPQDGALYFTVGGRQSESALYRIIWNGDSETAAGAPSDTLSETNASITQASTSTPASAALQSPEAARNLRRALERFHGGPNEAALAQAWPQLENADRFLCNAARVAVEKQPLDQWLERALSEPSRAIRTQALIAVARSAPRDMQMRWAVSLAELGFEHDRREEQLELLRAASLGVIRFNPLDVAARKRLLTVFDKSFPTGDHLVDRDLAGLLIQLGAPNMVERLLAMLDGAATQEEAIDAAVAASAAPGPWTVPQRARLLDWFDKAASLSGGRSHFGYVLGARNRFIAGFTPDAHAALGERISRPFVQGQEPTPVDLRPFVREWNHDELVLIIEADSSPRDLPNGRRMFSAASCYNCHRVAGEGSAVGPDLTGVGRRFGVGDIVRAIVEPDHEVSDQYRQMVFETGGRTVIGRVTNMNENVVMVSTDMLDPKKETQIVRSEIDEQYLSDASLMPAGLLNTLNEQEVLDLIAFLRNGGVAVATDAEASAPLPAASR